MAVVNHKISNFVFIIAKARDHRVLLNNPNP